MKLAAWTIALLAACSILGSCGGDDDPASPGATTAPMVYAQRMASADLPAVKASTAEGRILDTRHARLKIEVSRGTVVDGEPDTFEWIVIYDSQQELADMERVFAPVELPVGSYDNLRITTDPDRVVWECAFGDDLVDIPVETGAVMVFGDGGLFHYAAGGDVLESVAPGERLGGFEIRAGVTTHLTFLSNLDAVTWLDNDESGDWSQGDQVGGVTGLPGTETMGDFVVEYVE